MLFPIRRIAIDNSYVEVSGLDNNKIVRNELARQRLHSNQTIHSNARSRRQYNRKCKKRCQVIAYFFENYQAYRRRENCHPHTQV